MPINLPRKHHTVPQFYLKNFAIDEERTKLTTISKEGRRAVWMERSIKSIGYDRDYYVHLEHGRPVSVESDISRTIETPISQSDTWAKVASGRTDKLDRSDRGILYALVRHLEARTPHFEATANELSQMAVDAKSQMPFTEEEQRMHAFRRSNPSFAKFMSNFASTTFFNTRDFDSALITVARLPIPLRTTTAPTMAMPSPPHPAMHLPLPGMVPFQRVLPLSPTTLVSVIDGDFGGHFANEVIEEEVALGINRTVAGHFARFARVRHLITGRDRLIDDMIWAPYELISDTPGKMVFRRTD